MTARRDFLTSAVRLACIALTGRSLAVGQDSALGSDATPEGPSLLPKRDFRSKPFRIAVALGDSITEGWTATSPGLCWVNRLADSVTESQLVPMNIINSGIGGNVISPRSLGYEASGKPSAMERYQKDVVEHDPDLVTIAYGVNDARAGTAVGQFTEDLRHIVLDVKIKTGALIVILSTSFMTDFNRYPPFDRANIAVFEGYNRALRRLAGECDVLYADTFSAMGFAPWTVDPVDGVHPTNLGHRLIADCVFALLARNCSCLSQQARELRKNFKPWQDDSTLRKTS